ncbi:MAG: glycosyltransferase [Thermodesulfobacteriota bacterium]
MNILQVTRGALMGGGERHVLTLLEGLKEKDAGVRLAVFTEGRLADEARRLGMAVHVFPRRFRGDIRPLKGLIDLIREQRIDIIHTHLVSGNLYGRLAGKITGVKGIVTTLHHTRKEALGSFRLPFMTDLFFRGDILMGKLSDRMITPSDDLQRLLVRFGIKPSRMVTIPNAINLDKTRLTAPDIDACRRELGIPTEMKVVGMVGRLVEVKNFNLYIEAAAKVLGQKIPAVFLIIGEGPLRDTLEQQTVAAGLKDRFIFTGFRNDVFRLVGMMDLFVLCSRSETNPIALMEAMASGKPVIATDVGGVPEIVEHGVNGWLCPSDDVDCLAEAMTRLLSYPAQARDLGARAQATISERYSLPSVTARLLDVYKDLMN